MVIENIFRVLGKGYVVCAKGDELETMEIHCGEIIVRGEITFTITGIERIKYDDNWYSKNVEFILSPNVLVPDNFKIGEDIEILKNE